LVSGLHCGCSICWLRDGYKDGTFKPEQNISRVEFVKMAVVATVGPQGAGGSNWYDTYVQAATTAGIVAASDFNTGDWNTPMTRLELARAAVKATGSKNTDAKKWMFLATSTGLVQGMNDRGDLAPEGVTTRAQAITIIERIKALKAGQSLDTQITAVSQAEVAWHGTNVFSLYPDLFGSEIIKEHLMNKWDQKLMHLTTEGFSGSWDKLVLIDLANPDDPYRDLINVDKLYWNYIMENHPVSGYLDNYLLVAVSNLEINTVSKQDYVPLNVFLGTSFKPDQEARKAGMVSGITPLRDMDSRQPVNSLLIPKGGLKNDFISITIESPAVPGSTMVRQNLVHSPIAR
jgi:hypothetical protein